MRRRYWLQSWIGIALAGPIVLFPAWLSTMGLFHPNADEVRFLVGGQPVTYRDFADAGTSVYAGSVLIIWTLSIVMLLLVRTPPFWLVAMMTSINWLVIALAGSIFCLILSITTNNDTATITVLIISLAVTWGFCLMMAFKIFKRLRDHITSRGSISRIVLVHVIIAVVIIGGIVLHHSLVLPPPSQVQRREPTWDEWRASMSARPAPTPETAKPQQRP